MSTNIKPRVASVDVYQGDDLQRLSELHQAAQNAEKRYLQAKISKTLMADDDEGMSEAQEASDAFLDEATERAVTFELRSIGTKRYREIKLKHPPRKVMVIVEGEEQELLHEDDVDYKVNTETFPFALLTYVSPDNNDIRTITAPTYKTTDELTEELEELSDGDLTRLWTTAYFLNTALGADPKAARFSATPQSSGATSE